jgi:hypothetical protein
MTLIYAVKELAWELSRMVSEWIHSRPVFARMMLAAAISVGLLVSGKLVFGLLFPDPAADPFSYRKVSGTVSYEDGSFLPAQVLLTFIPRTTDVGTGNRYPRSGTAVVDRDTGHFAEATTRRPGDGLIRGSHSVVISFAGLESKASDIVLPEYLAPDTTPLSVNTDDRYFDLKVRKP